MKVRNLGRKSLEEVVWKMASPWLQSPKRRRISIRPHTQRGKGVTFDARNQKIGESYQPQNGYAESAGYFLLENGKIETTVTRAKEVRSLTEKMITIAKEDNLHNRRLVLALCDQGRRCEQAVYRNRSQICRSQRRICPALLSWGLAAVMPPKWRLSS